MADEIHVDRRSIPDRLRVLAAKLREGTHWSSVAVAIALEATADELAVKTEYGTLMSGGGYHIRWDDPEMGRIYPLAQWAPAQTRHGGVVGRRRVIVVEDWVDFTQETIGQEFPPGGEADEAGAENG